MKISMYIAVAVAAGAMTVVSHAKDVSPKENPAAEEAAAAPSTLGEVMKNLRENNGAAARNGADEVASITPAVAGLKQKNVDKTVTGSTRTPGKSGKKSAASGRPFHSIISRYASQYGVPVSLAHAVVSVESNYRPKARGRAGEVGLMQIKPATARMMGYSGSAKGLYEPETNIKYGMKYLAKAFQLGGGNTCSAILKYNAGHGAKRMNPVSSAYCQKVKRLIGGK